MWPALTCECNATDSLGLCQSMSFESWLTRATGEDSGSDRRSSELDDAIGTASRFRRRYKTRAAAAIVAAVARMAVIRRILRRRRGTTTSSVSQLSHEHNSSAGQA